MKKLNLIHVLTLATAMAACGGTDTGNALQSSIIVGTSSDNAPATELTSSTQLTSAAEGTSSTELTSSQLEESTGELRTIDLAAINQPLSQITLNKAEIYVRQVAAPYQGACTEKPLAKKTWSISRDPFTIDWLGDAESALSLAFGTNFTTCQIRMIAAQSSDKTIPSISIEGSTSTGTQFSITSTLPHLFVIHTASPTNFQSDDNANLELVFYLKDSFTGAQIDALGSTNLSITPLTHPVLFAGFLKNLRKNLRAHPFKRINGTIEKHRETTVGAGDENDDSFQDGELDD